MDGSLQPVETLSMSGSDLLIHSLFPPQYCILYRGVSDSKFDLIPTAFRKDGLHNMWAIANMSLAPHLEEISVNENTRRLCEIGVIECFYEAANAQGLKLPCSKTIDGRSLLTYSGQLSRDWIPENMEELVALAQHHGLPTRLLDWSTDINVALYFATRNITQKTIDTHPHKSIAVWELNRSAVSKITNIRVIIPRYSDNPFLNAQSGVLTYIKEEEPDSILPLDTVIKNACEKRPGLAQMLSKPILRKIEVKYRDVPLIQQSLKQRGLTAEKYFPSLQNIVDELKRKSNLTNEVKK